MLQPASSYEAVLAGTQLC